MKPLNFRHVERSIPLQGRRPVLAVLLFGLLGCHIVGAEPRPTLGFDLEMKTGGGWLQPTIRSLRVRSVVASGAAAKAGLQVEDFVLAVAGQRVEGYPARDLQTLFRRFGPQGLALVVRGVDGTERQLHVQEKDMKPQT